ncbi:MAG: hypothetical protein WBB45_21790 [Cyclobacteriaceae bacterium]
MAFKDILRTVADNVEDVARSAKDGTFKFILGKVLNKYIEEMLDFRIRPDEGTIFLRLTLKGETEPTVIHVRKYEVVKENNNGEEKDFLIIREIFISKEWMHIIAQDQVVDKPIDITKANMALKLHII